MMRKPTHLGLYLYFDHLVLVHAVFDKALHISIKLHEDDISHIGRQQRGTFPDGDDVIQEEDDEHDQIHYVEGDVSKEWPPCQVQDLPGEDGTHPDDKEDVEDS